MPDSKPAFVPSARQVALFDFVERGRGSSIILAVAGAGKSTSIAHALARIPEHASVQVLMFNAAVCRDFREKLEEVKIMYGRAYSRVRVSTFHGLGWAALLKCLRARGVASAEPDGKKLLKLMREKFAPEIDSIYGSFAARLVSYAKGEGVGAITPDTEDAWWRLVQHHDLSLDETPEGVVDPEAEGIRIARQLLALSNEAARAGVVDFDDQLYLPVLWRLRLWGNDHVFIDEAQDTNPIRRALAKMALRAGGRLHAVGDPRQGIYGFTGASTDAMDLLRSEFSATELRLTVSYRCSRAVAEHAREIVPYFESAPGAAEGAVRSMCLRDALGVLGPSDAILCRNVKPLIELAYDLIARGVGCAVLGREIGQGLVVLIKRMRARGLDNLLEKLEEFREREVAKHLAKGEEGKAESISDRVDCIEVVAGRLDERSRTVPALMEKIEGLFTDGSGVLVLSTMHKAKGREWRRVGIWRADLCPSKWARQVWQQEQEQNLAYVARTRAMEELIYLRDDPKESAS